MMDALAELAELEGGDSFVSRHIGPSQSDIAAMLHELGVALDGDRRALHAALVELAEQDPLIALRQDDARGDLVVSLYGEVQQEVLRDTLAAEHGIDVEFRDTVTVCIERPAGVG